MSVQFNLLPDVKMEFDRQQRLKRFVYAVSFLASAAVIAIFIVSFLSVNVLQKKLLSDANGDITVYSNRLKAIPNLQKILTIQSQLGSLPNLHQQKHYASRLFTYLPQITPTNINLGDLQLDTTKNSLEISGTADKVETINTFVDTLKFTTYSTDGSINGQKNAFNNVVLSKVDRDDKGASYTIDTLFDPALFNSTQNLKLIVPSETTTRSVIDSPDPNSILFNGQTGQKDQTGSSSQGGQ